MRGEEFTQASDVYSLGLVLWEIITGKIPFAEYGRETDQLMYQVRRDASMRYALRPVLFEMPDYLHCLSVYASIPLSLSLCLLLSVALIISALFLQVLRGARPPIGGDWACPEAYTALVTACWQEGAADRPLTQAVVEELYSRCWLHMVHGKIFETTHTVDLNVLAECYEKEKSSIAIKATFSAARPSYYPR
jgi:hypothetical protein